MKKIFQLNTLAVLIASCLALLIVFADASIYQDLSIVGKSSVIVIYIGICYLLIKQ